MGLVTDRNEFFSTVRRALGRDADAGPGRVPDATAYSQDAPSVGRRAWAVLEDAEARGDDLLAALERSAGGAGWKVARAESAEEAAQYVASLARDRNAASIVRSDHPVFDQVDLESGLSNAHIELTVMAADESAERRPALREKAVEADLGVTGVDYAIAETGSCVLLAGKGVSRLVALLPPVHVAIVRRGQVLPSLDELFTLRRDEFYLDNLGSYMNIITGPSRSADIEQTIVTGVHGPGEVHMVLLG